MTFAQPNRPADCDTPTKTLVLQEHSTHTTMPSVRNVAWGLLAAAAVASASDVTQLKKDTFDDFVKENDIVLAECMLPS